MMLGNAYNHMMYLRYVGAATWPPKLKMAAIYIGMHITCKQKNIKSYSLMFF